MPGGTCGTNKGSIGACGRDSLSVDRQPPVFVCDFATLARLWGTHQRQMPLRHPATDYPNAKPPSPSRPSQGCSCLIFSVTVCCSLCLDQPVTFLARLHSASKHPLILLRAPAKHSAPYRPRLILETTAPPESTLLPHRDFRSPGLMVQTEFVHQYSQAVC